jgi:hypothetical protein
MSVKTCQATMLQRCGMALLNWWDKGQGIDSFFK